MFEKMKDFLEAAADFWEILQFFEKNIHISQNRFPWSKIWFPSSNNE